MPTEVYEIIAQGARYWFLFLMALIVWRSFRWYRKDRRQYKKRLRLLPDAGYVGEFVTIRGNAQLPTGTILPVPWEGIIGSGRGCDIFLPVPGVAPKHCWFSYDREDGLQLEPYHGRTVQVDDQTWTGRGENLRCITAPACMWGTWSCACGCSRALRPPHGPMCCGTSRSPAAGNWRQQLPS